jgi:glutamate-1-semialdehyde 2,1-aminomutase
LTTQPFTRSQVLSERLHRTVPGGAHTYAKGDDQYPERMAPVIARGRGARVWDVDGNEYVELGSGLRSVVLGHAHPAVSRAAAAEIDRGTNFVRPSRIEVEAADRLLECVPTAEMVKFTKNGSDATTAAVRLARAVTGRALVAVCGDHPFFSTDDWFIARTPMAAGIPEQVGALTVEFPYGDLEAASAMFAAHPDAISCVVLEGRKDAEPPPGYLTGLRDLAHRHGALFVLDEIINGFRLCEGGTQRMYDVVPDLSTFGKALGNGFAVSALAGRREVMERGGLRTSDERVFLLSTTHGAETHALAAAIAVMSTFLTEDVCTTLHTIGEELATGVQQIAERHGIADHLLVRGHPSNLVFATLDRDGRPSQQYRTLFMRELIRHRVLAPSFVVSAAMTPSDLDHTLGAVDAAAGRYAAALEAGDPSPWTGGRPTQPVFRTYVDQPVRHSVTRAEGAQMKVAVFGLGYVGAVTAAGLASHGHTVVGVDVEPSKVSMVNSGQSPVAEPGLAELVSEAVASGRLRAALDAREALDDADVSLICVGTPSNHHGGTNLTFLERCLDDIGDALRTARAPASGFHAVVVRSTVPPGTIETLVEPRTAAMARPDLAVGAAMCPEFLREGSGLSDFFTPPLLVLGTHDARATGVVSRLMGFLDCAVDVADPRTAEALKYACNAFHATKVSFANEMGRVLRQTGVDARAVMSLLVKDDVLNISPTYLRPGFAYGGSCLPKDMRSLIDLARRNSTDVPLLTGVVATNDLLLREVVDRIVALGARSVALLGLSFKSDTDDLRESPNLEVAERLVGKGFDIRIFDPVVNPSRLVGSNKQHLESRLPHVQRLLCASAGQALDGADIAVVSTTDQEAIAAVVAAAPAVVLDLCGRLGPDVEGLPGYQGVGW